MKTTIRCLLPLLLATTGRALDAVPQDAKLADAPTFTIAERGPHHRIWTNSAGGTYTELANGLHYLDPNGNWVESSEEIQIVNGYGLAQQGQHQVIFAPNAHTVPAIDLLAPDGSTRLQSRILGLAYYDAASGKSVMIAETKDATGQLIAPNVVIYPDSCTDFRADIRTTYTKYGFEQDVIVRQQPPPPQNFGLDANTTRLQIWTEFLNPPVPQQQPRVLYQESDPQTRQAMVEPDLIDYELDFGSMTVGPGAAFTVGDDATDPLNRDETAPVCKEWAVIDNRTFLIESIPYPSLKPMLDTLPQPQAANGNRTQNARMAALKKPKTALDRSQLVAQFNRTAGVPARSAAFSSFSSHPGRSGTSTHSRPAATLTRRAERREAPSNPKTELSNSPLPARSRIAAFRRQRAIQLSKSPLPPQRGVVLDYTIVNANKVNYVFQGDTTYYISAPVILSGSGTGPTNTTTFEGGSVLKYSPTNTAKLTVQNRITWQGTSYRPVILTARDDTSVGDTITSGTIINYDTALYIDAATANTNAILQNLRVAYATNAIVLNGNTGHIISHAQFLNCQNGIKPLNTIFSLRNALFHNVLNDLNATTASTSTGHCEHVTADTASWLNYNNYLTLNMTNSLLVSVTNTMTFNNTNAVSIVTSTNGVWQAVGAGYHYLADNTYRNLGTTNINPSLAADLKRMTTYPPIVLTTDFTVTTTLTPQAQRDTDTPDLGYHLDPLDYCWTGLNLTNSATLLLTNGVAIGLYGTSGTTLWSGVRFASEGKPGSQMNRLVRYNTVQEQSIAWGATGSFSLMNVSGSPATLPNLHLRFTDLAGLAAPDGMRAVCSPHKIGWTDATDCSLRGEYLYVSGTSGITVGLTNNLITRSHLSFNQTTGTDFALYLRNNLFWHGTCELWRYTNANVWAVHDNLFDTVTIQGGVVSTNSYNGYFNTTALSGGSNNQTLTTADYQTGPLGAFYYPTNGASGGLTNLINAGSRTADLAGLYHYTTSIGLTKETNSIVDIGYHYVATDANGNPLDFDGDGIPDYLEDYNGNGVFDSGETDWKTYNSPNRLGANGLQVFTPLK